MTYQPFYIHGAQRPSRWLITADHAANTVPAAVNNGDLGMPATDMARHIAYDPGSSAVAKHLAELLDCPMIESNFSRLVIDANRGEDDPTLLMKLSDGSIIPANRGADDNERKRRLTAFHRPYHDALEALATRQDNTILIPIHSFTRQYGSHPPRPWHIGVLYPKDNRFASPLIARLKREPDLCVGDNEPYLGYLPGDSVDRHATAHGHMNALIEIRNDLIQTEAQQYDWAKRLAPILQATLADIE